MKKEIIFRIGLVLCSIISTLGCSSERKVLATGNRIYHYKNNQSYRSTKPNYRDSLIVYELKKPFKSKIEDKTDYIIVKNTPLKTDSLYGIEVVPVNSQKINLYKGAYYTFEKDIVKDDRSFRYFDIKLALQTLTIPLKFRKKVGDGTKYPSTVETGVNIGFAPVLKWNLNVFNPMEKTMGKTLNTYSLNAGTLLNLGATSLSNTDNSPGLLLNRKAATLSYGGFLLFGINNLNFGYAFGWDKVFGSSGNFWIYQNKLWHGVVISLDIIK